MELILFALATAAIGALAVRWGADSTTPAGDERARHFV
jgi:hypothetical protein